MNATPNDEGEKPPVVLTITTTSPGITVRRVPADEGVSITRNTGIVVLDLGAGLLSWSTPEDRVGGVVAPSYVVSE